MRSIRFALPATLLAITTLLTFAPAQNSAAPSPSPVASAPNTGTMSNDDLPALLENLGYESRAEGDDRVITIVRGDWTFVINIGIYGPEKTLWLFTYLREIPDDKVASPTPYIKLLWANNNIGPHHFFLAGPAEDPRRLHMGRGLDNRQLTPALIRQAIDAFMETIRRTADLWQTDSWNQPHPAATPAPTSKPTPKPTSEPASTPTPGAPPTPPPPTPNP